jgi:hypothetical protein
MSLRQIQAPEVPLVGAWQAEIAQAIGDSNARLAKMSKEEKVAQLRRNASSKAS